MVFYAIYPRYAQRIKYAPCTVHHTPYIYRAPLTVHSIPCTRCQRRANTNNQNFKNHKQTIGVGLCNLHVSSDSSVFYFFSIVHFRGARAFFSRPHKGLQHSELGICIGRKALLVVSIVAAATRILSDMACPPNIIQYYPVT